MASSAFAPDSPAMQRGGSSSNGAPPSGLPKMLASVLPRGYTFGVFHLSTPPTKISALCSAPPDEREDRTYCERHFLAVSIGSRATPPQPGPPSPPAASADALLTPVLVLAIEVFIFTTAYSTTLFVAKADSTGYLHLLNLPRGTPSPVRQTTSAFVSYLVEQRRRQGVQSVVSLFARSQAQYLFPGSVENSGKHVLDDRGLVKWWCRVLNGLLEGGTKEPGQRSKAQRDWGSVRGYLIVPGLDNYDMRALLPRTPKAKDSWAVGGHPLEKISHYCHEYDWVPPRCLIPRFPDDPKSRFRDELDEEATRSHKHLQNTGSWKSVKTLDQFWDMMAFRQECSSGRMTGFIWVVLDPGAERSTGKPSTACSVTSPLPTPCDSFSGASPTTLPSTPPKKRTLAATSAPQSSPLKPQTATPNSSKSSSKSILRDAEVKKKKKKKLKGPVIPRLPKVKTEQRNYLLDRPVSTAYYHWPPEGRGQKIVDEADYKRSVELLLRLDFANLEIATSSSRRWIDQVGMGARWGLEVKGQMEKPVGEASQTASGAGAATTLLPGMIRRKRPAEDADLNASSEAAVADSGSKSVKGVNVLGVGLVRKKRKDESGDAAAAYKEQTPPAHGTDESAPKVNVLGAGLVRKKAKGT